MIDQHVHPDFTADFAFEIDKGGGQISMTFVGKWDKGVMTTRRQQSNDVSTMTFPYVNTVCCCSLP